MGKLRRGSTDDFPVESRSGGVGYLLVYEDPREEQRRKLVEFDKETGERDYGEWTEISHWKHFKSTKGEKESLLAELEEVNLGEVTLLGYWSGEYRTDMHQLEPEKYKERLSNAEL